MQEVIDHIWIGSDKDDAEAKRRGYARLVCAKDANGGHREMLGYTTMGAPQGPNYLFVQRGNHAAMNLIDVDDPEMIPTEMLDQGLEFAFKQYKSGHKILFHCNAGHSRSPSCALAFLRTIGEMPHSLKTSMHVFKTLYRPYDPGVGMRKKLAENWNRWENIYARVSS